MATSTFAKKQKVERDHLFSKLVYRILGLDFCESERMKAFKFAKANVEYHQFADPEPRQVQRLYAGLQEKLLAHAQLERGEKLGRCVQKLFEIPWECQTLEIQSSVLVLLHELANHPTEHLESFPGEIDWTTKSTPTKTKMNIEDALDPSISSDAKLLMSEMRERFLTYSDEDEDALSDWSNLSGESGEITAEPENDVHGLKFTSDEQLADDSSNPVGSSKYSLLAKSAAPVQDRVLIRKEGVFHINRPCSLLPRCEMTAEVLYPLRVEEGSNVVSEYEVVREVLRMLLGIDGRFFCHERPNKFSLRCPPRVLHLSPAVLRGMLESFLALANDVAFIVDTSERFASPRCTGSPSPSSSGTNQCDSKEMREKTNGRTLCTTMTGKAFSNSLFDVAHGFRQLVSLLEDASRGRVPVSEAVRLAGAPGANGALPMDPDRQTSPCSEDVTGLTILMLHTILAREKPRLRFIVRVCEAYVTFLSSPEGCVASNRMRSSSLVKLLYDFSSNAALDVSLAVPLRLLLDTVQPLFDFMDTWSREGIVVDPADEFFVVFQAKRSACVQKTSGERDTGSDTIDDEVDDDELNPLREALGMAASAFGGWQQNSRLWMNAFTLSRNDCWSRIPFLEPLLEGLLLCGKSVALLPHIIEPFARERQLAPPFHARLICSVIQEVTTYAVSQISTSGSMEGLATTDSVSQAQENVLPTRASTDGHVRDEANNMAINRNDVSVAPNPQDEMDLREDSTNNEIEGQDKGRVPLDADEVSGQRVNASWSHENDRQRRAGTSTARSCSNLESEGDDVSGSRKGLLPEVGDLERSLLMRDWVDSQSSPTAVSLSVLYRECFEGDLDCPQTRVRNMVSQSGSKALGRSIATENTDGGDVGQDFDRGAELSNAKEEYHTTGDVHEFLSDSERSDKNNDACVDSESSSNDNRFIFSADTFPVLEKALSAVVECTMESTGGDALQAAIIREKQHSGGGAKLPPCDNPRNPSTHSGKNRSSELLGESDLWDAANVYQLAHEEAARTRGTLVAGLWSNLPSQEEIPDTLRQLPSGNQLERCLPNAFPVPLLELFRRCLTTHALSDERLINQKLLDHFVEEQQLLVHLAAMRMYFFAEVADVLAPFLQPLFCRLSQAHASGLLTNVAVAPKGTSSSVPGGAVAAVAAAAGLGWAAWEHEIRLALSHTLRDDYLFTRTPGVEHVVLLPTGEPRLSISVKPLSGAEKPMLTIDAINNLCFTYEAGWPVNIILNSEVLSKYNVVMRFILQIQWARFLLDRCAGPTPVHRLLRGATGSRRNSRDVSDDDSLDKEWHEVCIIRGRLLHFVSILQYYVVFRVLRTTSTEFEHKFRHVTSFSELISLHNKFLATVIHRCLLDPNAKGVAMLRNIILRLLELCVRFHAAVASLLDCDPGSPGLLWSTLDTDSASNVETDSAHRDPNDDLDKTSNPRGLLRSQYDLDSSSFEARAENVKRESERAWQRKQAIRELLEIKDECLKYVKFVVSVLQHQVLRGRYPHLEDFILRLNYNDYYSEKSPSPHQ
eukprot:Rmarinus@m.11927